MAVKGLGGYHLACRADREESVAALRARKHREDKPFALMAGSLEQARELVEAGVQVERLLSARERPIVLAPRIPGAAVAASVAPGAAELGVMLPYSPLHHLLLADLGGPLVMTSGNMSDEPIAFEDGDAGRRLGEIADLMLVHNRPIETRTDDSVVRVLDSGQRQFLRRSRGYVPASLALPDHVERPMLACGAELKNTFCLAKGGRAWVSHHIGDLENYEALRSFTAGIEHFQRLFAVTPKVLAHDLHPEYLSTKYAVAQPEVELGGVQHHHAHLAAVLAEHGETGPAVGAIFDGTGYGADGTVWGGELLVGDLADFRRAGSLLAVPLPGGSRAIREPWRMACSWLVAALGGQPDVPRALAGTVDPGRWEKVCRLARTGTASPLTSSVGRLFDAVAALCGIRPSVNYEGQAAIEFEAACDPSESGSYPIEIAQEAGFVVMDPRGAIRGVLRDVEAGTPPGRVAARFHEGLARATVQACLRIAEAAGTEAVVVSGGVFQNRRLVESVRDGLDRRGLRVLLPERLPPGDGAISYGQAATVARRMALGRVP